MFSFTVFLVCLPTEGGAKGNPKNSDEEEITPARLDMRVGKIVSVEQVRQVLVQRVFMFEFVHDIHKENNVLDAGNMQ